ncbi:DUF1801 domain-containing protein [Simiduia curdlanivorans]|uniref:DUF1801 domain-containing protein n=1 Tax=Simiduia curdlanivorans TaxID=1492769 RepID=A0ABV8V2B1_9GAMM|nr:DUF1801 domain-containing protein [Simiduia curdlanivorans]MDN3637356.1 DUF1801 domain-containing protein [Simiduia curdlanivorans]
MQKDVQVKFASYPEHIRPLMLTLRSLIFEVAAEDGIDDLEECLKWGEPSYLCKHGSTLRIDWKAKEPNQYAMYFHCQTSLVATFTELYGEALCFSGNRAIILDIHQKLPEQVLKHCVSLTLRYHSLKHKPLLGA